MTKRLYRSGDTIIREGDIGEEFYLVSQGEVGVTTARSGGAVPSRIATLRRGDFFGERALITGERRNATIAADGEVEVFVLGKQAFENALNKSMSFKEQLFNVYFQRQ